MVQKTAIRLLYGMAKSKKPREEATLLENQEQFMQLVGARLKFFRIERGFSSAESFAYQHNIDRSQYGKYERGKDMRLSSLVVVLTALQVTVEEFFSEGFGSLAWPSPIV